MLSSIQKEQILQKWQEGVVMQNNDKEYKKYRIDSYNYQVRQQKRFLQYRIIMQSNELLNIEKLAHEACFQTNYQIKSKAQQKFYALIFNLSRPELQQLVNGFTQTTLFVTMQYIYKAAPSLADLRTYFLVINESVQRWYSKNLNATLIRDDNQPLQNYVQNSVGRTLGQCMKHLYLKKQNVDWLTNFIKERINLRYRLYLWKLFIQTVSVVDNDLSFLVYRSMVYNFQEYIIPLIMDSLLPYFQSVKEQIEINQLANMQSHLTVNENNGIETNHQVGLFNPGQVKFTDLVFQVLKQIICFNYNITYSQFQSDTPIDNCLVCFPEPVTKKVANKQFLSSIFYVAQKLINDSQFEHNNITNPTFLGITLECIQKIMLTKLFYCPLETKNQFIKTVLISMSRLLGSKKLSQASILSLIQSNLKFLINIQLYQIKTHNAQYLVWINRVKDILMQILSKSVIHIDNQLVSQSVELTAKIIQESVAPQLKDQALAFKKLGVQIASVLIDRLFSQNYSIIGASKVRNYEDLKKNLSTFLKRFRQLCCLDLKLILDKLQHLILKVFNSNDANLISNIYFLLTQFCDQSIFQRNLIYEAYDTNNNEVMSKILLICFEWINNYRNHNGNIQIIEIAMLLFIEKMLSQALSSFNYEDNGIRITSELFKCLSGEDPNINNTNNSTNNNKNMVNVKKGKIDSQQFLNFCYNEIAKNLMNSDFVRASYTFEVLTTLLLKFKWGIKRQYFKQTKIIKNVLQLCKNLSEQNFDGEMIVLRKQLFKIITNISFDDILDDYRTNITQLVRNLQKALGQNRWKAMYDLTGICQAIDTSVIYRYFMITLQKSKIPIPVIMNQLFSHVEETSQNNKNSKIQLIKSILQLNVAMIDNKGQRLAGTKSIFYNYKLISHLMPYWAILFEREQFRDEQWDQVVIQLYKILNTLLKNNNTNFFILERTVETYEKYILYLLVNMVSVANWIEVYPNLFTQYRTCMQMISKQLMQVIFCHANINIPKYFNQLLTIFLKFNMKSIDSLNQGNKTNQQNLQIYFQIIKNVFKYLRNAKKLVHKTEQINNLVVLNDEMQVKYEFIYVLFKFGIATGKKMPRFLQLICRVIHNMDFLARSAMPVISEKLGLDEAKRQQLLKIWNETDEDRDQFVQQIEDNQFLYNIKDWFKKCDASSMLQPDY